MGRTAPFFMVGGKGCGSLLAVSVSRHNLTLEKHRFGQNL
jgi:hypothetical protein